MDFIGHVPEKGYRAERTFRLKPKTKMAARPTVLCDRTAMCPCVVTLDVTAVFVSEQDFNQT